MHRAASQFNKSTTAGRPVRYVRTGVEVLSHGAQKYDRPGVKTPGARTAQVIKSDREAGSRIRSGVTYANFVLVSITLAERVTMFGSFSWYSSPSLRVDGPEMLIAPKISPLFWTGAATHRIPSIFSSWSYA